MNENLSVVMASNEGKVVSQPSNSVTPADLLRHALDSGADLDRLEKLMELQQKYEANEARKAFADDMARFKTRPLVIVKEKTVSFDSGKGRTEYDHATIGNVVDVIVPALAEFGFSHRWDLEQRDGQVIVTCVITHRLGHSQATSLMAAPDSSGGKNGIQSIVSTKTYLQRHTLLAATGAATMDQQDDDGALAEMQQMAAEVRSASVAKRKIGAKGFAAALEAIRAGTYTLEEIESTTELTEEQRAQAVAATGAA